jgi:NADPH-dependent 2,4-dienoyl-CoA reductase/sulfur reductase-like enzyme
MAAAAEAVEYGLSVTLVDAFPMPGGQYYKQTPPALGETPLPDESARKLLNTMGTEAVRQLTSTSVWGLFPETRPEGSRKDSSYLLCLYGPPGSPRRLNAQTVILAPGAYDRPVPFPGWTLPGVITAGAALTLVKHQRILPGRRILLSGTGPLQLVLARHLLEAGAELTGILDANPFPWGGWRHAAALWGQWERLREGWESWQIMHKAGLRIRWGTWVWSAEGAGRVERAVIGPTNGLLPDTSVEKLTVDTICLGHGFAPSIQLSRLAGCDHRYQAEHRAYVPLRDEWLQTTQQGLFVAGDGAGIGGKDVAQLEGRLAAMGAARTLGREIPSQKVAAVHRDLNRQRRFAAVLQALFPLPAHLTKLLTEDTLLCRCEEVTAGDVRQAIAEGATTVSAVRMLTRAGMGRCQGRMCGSSVAELLARELEQPVQTVGQATPRPPVIPIPLDGLIDDEASA